MGGRHASEQGVTIVGTPNLARLLVTLYLTIAIMGIGFAMLLGGPPAAGAAARFFFVGPVQALVSATHSAGRMVLGTLWAGAAWGANRIAQATRREVKELVADMRWVVRRFDR
jgi:hypothetical protein